MKMTKQDVSRASDFIEFTLHVNALKKSEETLKKESADAKQKGHDDHENHDNHKHNHAFEFELDLNPFLRIYEKEERVLKIHHMKCFFEYMVSFMERLEDLDDCDRISRVYHKQNSPSLTNISYTSSFNGDLPPPKNPKDPMR
ncbi:hypothetical protein [Chryseolinea lacunae]|uniref:Uncharacterized protein n=1 Tax=Chryseolinea lacunae TaxID=2801331 RepID=A0ABS1L138_9BACT|nr:hypothetical protein [Chryseolinea lacunae]MBL0745404.1 hypothetical protein [Chryseolinea lacunae]